MTHDPGRSRPESGGSPLPVFSLEPLEPRLLLSASPLDTQDPLLPTSSNQSEVVAAATGTHTLGIDVSHFQGNINWATVAASGIDFVWAKATEGVNFVDSKWVTNVTGANNAGLFVSGYHFATPYTGGVNDASSEAFDFYQAVQPYLGDGFLRPALDLERGNSLSTTVLSNWVHDFMNTFSSLSGGIVPIIYMNGSYASSEVNSSVNTYDLWYARWPASPDFNNPPAAPGVWSGVGYDLWQYSDSTSVSGISGAVDGDVFHGDLAAFSAKYAINTTPPPPDDHGNDLATATVVGMPSTTAGDLEVGTDIDWFELSLNANESYTFSVLGNGLTSGEVRLYSGVGTLLATDTGPASGGTLAELQFTPVAGGTYFVEVSSPSLTGAYNLAVQETDDHGDSIAQASTNLLSNPSALGDLQTSTDADFFQLSVTAGMVYDLSVSDFPVFGTPLADAVLTLYDAGGAQVNQASGSNPGGIHAQLNWTATTSGTLYASVTSNVGSMGDYLITIAESSGLLAGDLDGNGFVGVDDLNIVLSNWNQNVTPGDLSVGDATGEGFVGVDDLNIVLGNWNAGTPPVAAVSSQQNEALAAVGTQIFGIDVSVFQGTINWANVKNSGKDFAFIRAIDRFGVTDSRFTINMNGANAAGVVAGAYQFVSPWTDGFNDAVQEATLFANVLAPYLTDGFLRPVIDIEGYAGFLSPDPIDLDNTVLTNWVHDYMTTFINLTGIEPLIYSNTNYAKNAYDTGVNVYDLWLARWTNDPNVLPLPTDDGVWNGFDLWQYSSTTSVPGISGNVDGDVFFGDLTQLITNYGITTLPDDHGNDLATATVVAMPSSTAGQLETGLDLDWFELSLNANQSYTFSVLGNGLTSGEVRLYSGVGTLLATDTGPASGGTLAELSFTPVASGTYFVEVSSPSLTGAYNLAVQETDDHGDSIAQASTNLLSNPSTLGDLQTSTDADFFQLSVTAGMVYDLSVSDFPAFGTPLADAVLTLYDAGGAQVNQASGSNPGGIHAQLNWTATTSGTLYASVTSNVGSMGDYLVTIAESSGLLAGDLDGNGFVGVDDLNIVLSNWNQNVTPGDLLVGDATGEGFVGVDDLNIVLGNWNAGTPPVAAVSSSQSGSVASVSAASSAAAESGNADSTSLVKTQRRQHQRADAPVAQSHTDRARGLAIANWRASGVSAFGGGNPGRPAPVFGLWESDDDNA